MGETGETELAGKIVYLPELREIFDLLPEKLPDHYDRQELKSFLEIFNKGCGQIKELYETGGDLGEIGFKKCDLFDHNWHHVQGDIAMVAKILPGYLQSHQRETPSLEEIKDLFWATLLHDVGWLRTKGEVEEDLYKWGGEKFFVHCQQGVDKAAFLLAGMEKKGVAESLDLSRIERIKRFIKRTEFNPLEEEKEEVEIDESDPRLGDVLRAADNLSYFCDPDDVPERVQKLFKEAQAIARFECKRTWEYYKDVIAAGLEIMEEELNDRFKQGRLTIADLKFPGQTVLEFVADDYVEENLEKFNIWIEYLKTWYGDGFNKDKENYLLNIGRIRAMQALANTSKDCPPCSAMVNPLCYLEGSLMGKDLREIAISFGLEGIVEDWNAIDLKMLGVTEKDIFQRLVTPQIRLMLKTADPKQRKQIFTALLEHFIQTHQIKRRPGKERQDEYFMAIAPLAYLDEETGKELLTPQEITEVFSVVNQKEEPDRPILTPVWTIRRDKLNIDFSDYAEKIKKSGVKKVVLAGREEEKYPLGQYKDLIAQLTNAGIEVIVQAGQVMKSEPSDLAEKNITAAITIAEENPQVTLLGLQVGSEAVDKDRLKKLGASGRILASLSSDLDTSQLQQPIQDINKHPLKRLMGQGLNILVADPHDFFPSSIEIEAVMIIDPPPFAQLGDDQDKIGKYANYYILQAEKLLKKRS